MPMKLLSMKTKYTIITFFRNLICVLAIPATVITIVSVVFVILGFRPYILASPSMEPRYPEGSFCVVDTGIALEDLKENDIVIYVDGDSQVMHRLISYSPPNAVLQGDANSNSQTVKLDSKTFVGRLKWSAPRLGKTVDKVISTPWIWLVVGAMIMIGCVPVARATDSTVKASSTALPATEDKDEQINTDTPTQEVET